MTETRVLLVEDDPGYARFLQEVLAETEGTTHRLTAVDALEAALECLGKARFDIVLLDLGLPDADGTEALRAVSAAAPATPIVVLSALNELEVALESMRLGAQEYLVKGQSEHLLLPRAIRYALERKRLQDGFQAARAEAERANAAKDDFLAMLGHELRNPLAPIVTALAMIRTNPSAGFDRERAIVERQVQHLVRMVDDLLDVSRIARGKLDLQLTDLDLANVIADGVETARPLLESRRQTLTTEVPPGLFVNGDGTRLAQVMANMLTNAAKYTSPGGKVAVTARADGDVAEVCVRDNGIGIATTLLPRVFDIFEQGPRSIDRAAGGLGLGLAIVKSVVTLHGGTVTAESPGVGQGSTFRVRLPLRHVQRQAEVTTRASAARSANPRRILIVDDNEDAADMLDLWLHTLGHITRTARDGRSALDVLATFTPDLALLDIGLPGMDGYELARRIRAMTANNPPVLIAVSGYGQQSDRERSRAAGFQHHLVKPVDARVLEEILAAAAP